MEETKWISANNKPSIGRHGDFKYASDMLLLSDGEFVYYGQYENSPEGEVFIDSNGDDFEDDGIIITHWMPLPDAPNK